MTPLEKAVAVCAAVCFTFVAFAQTYKLGQRSWKAYADEYVHAHAYQAGYSQGWLDARCSKEGVCNSAQ